jgi:hypothetical protein
VNFSDEAIVSEKIAVEADNLVGSLTEQLDQDCPNVAVMASHQYTHRVNPALDFRPFCKLDWPTSSVMENVKPKKTGHWLSKNRKVPLN